MSSRQLIGVDVGGTKLAVATLEAGRLEVREPMPTAAASADALIDEVAGAIETVRTERSAAVGIGVPSVVEFETGRVKWSANVKLADVSLRTVLEGLLGLPVIVDNDTNCAALAEAHDEVHPGVTDLVMFTLGTGVGGGLVLGGRVYRGATGAAGELGHTLIGARLDHGAPEALGFPQPGSLEGLASGHVLDALAEETAREHHESALGRLRARGDEVRGADVVTAAQAGDAYGRALLELLGERLGVAIANAINTFDPHVVVIGGGLAAAGELLLEPARRIARRFVVPGAGDATEIRLARYGADAGVRGAALLARQELEAGRRDGAPTSS
jgi:glucokinase